MHDKMVRNRGIVLPPVLLVSDIHLILLRRDVRYLDGYFLLRPI
jgi:hypothetical protein